MSSTTNTQNVVEKTTTTTTIIIATNDATTKHATSTKESTNTDKTSTFTITPKPLALVPFKDVSKAASQPTYTTTRTVLVRGVRYTYTLEDGQVVGKITASRVPSIPKNNPIGPKNLPFVSSKNVEVAASQAAYTTTRSVTVNGLYITYIYEDGVATDWEIKRLDDSKGSGKGKRIKASTRVKGPTQEGIVWKEDGGFISSISTVHPVI